MKLIHFDKSALREQPNGSLITFAKKSTNINKIAAQLLGIKAGDSIAVCQDEEEPGNWYIYKSAEGFNVAQSNEHQFKVSTQLFKQSWCECFELSIEENYKFTIPSEPVKYKGLLLFQLNQVE